MERQIELPFEDRDRQLVLRTRQGQPRRRAAYQERHGVIIVHETLQSCGLQELVLGIPISIIHVGRNDAQSASALAANRGEQRDVVVARDPEASTNGLANQPLRQQVRKEGVRDIVGVFVLAQGKAQRDRERLVRQPARVVAETESAPLVIPEESNCTSLVPHRKRGHGFHPRGAIQTSSPIRWRTLSTSWSRTVGLPFSTSLRNRVPTPASPAAVR
jgi:hypothetical protein